jgi:hypothetical protein
MVAAVTSFLIGMITAGVLSAIVVFFAYSTREEGPFRNNSVIQRRPILTGAFTYALVWIVVVASGVLPIAQYHGSNNHRFGLETEDTYQFTVYPPPAYVNEVVLSAMGQMNSDDSVTLEIVFSNQSGQAAHEEIVISSSDVMWGSMDEVSSFEVPSGTYEVSVTAMFYQNGIPTPGTTAMLTYEMSQRLAAGHMNELLAWNVELLVAVVVGIGYLLYAYVNDFSFQKPELKEGKRERYDRTYEEYRSYEEQKED